jgi:hypothetical protein
LEQFQSGTAACPRVWQWLAVTQGQQTAVAHLVDARLIQDIG